MNQQSLDGRLAPLEIYTEDAVIFHIKVCLFCLHAYGSITIQILAEFFSHFHDILHNNSSDQGTDFLAANAQQ